MSDFPISEAQISLDYYQPQFQAAKQDLSNITVTEKVEGVESTRIIDSIAGNVNNARHKLLKLLKNNVIAQPNASYWKMLNDIESLFKQRQFIPAKNIIDNQLAIPIPNLPNLTERTIELAQTRNTFKDAVEKRVEIEIDIDIDVRGRPRTTVQTFIHDLRGYSGPTLNIQRLMKLYELMSGGAEHKFRVTLLRAESLFGQAKATAISDNPVMLYNEAIKEFQKLLPRPTSGGVFNLPPRNNAREKSVAIRSATAHLALGDYLFRRSFKVDASERDEILNIYKTARSLVGAVLILQNNPLCQQLAEYADMQIDKISAGYNFLGYYESYVPPYKLKDLETLANKRIKAATETRDNFKDYRTRGDDLIEELKRLKDLDQIDKALGIEIAQLSSRNAKNKLESAQKVINHLNTKDDFLMLDFGANLTKSIFTTIAPGDPDAPAFTFDGSGVTSSIVGYFDRRNDIKHQKEMAQLEEGIAQRNKKIADLELQIAQSRLDFVNESINAKESGTFNADRFIALANTYEDMTRRHTDAAFEFLYLFERAINFRRLESLQEVQSAATATDPLLAPEKMNEILVKLSEKAKGGIGQDNVNWKPFSLMLHYPLEFSQFQQTGRMEFNISLYDVEKHMDLKGHSNIRIKEILVEPRGNIPAIGYTGTLIHRGTTMFRDKATTPQDPSSGRYIPTNQQVTNALAALKNGQLDRLTVGGISLLALEEHARRFSSQPDFDIPASERDFGLAPIENYGIPGTWHIELEGLDPSHISDIWLSFVLSFEQIDTDLETRLDQLIQAYETELADGDALDRITAFSLKQRFPNTFSQLPTGAGTFDLQEQDFLPNITDLKVKTVIAQLLDSDNNGIGGIELEISQPASSFSLVKTTGDDGFSEDLTLEIPVLDNPDDRPPNQGTWQIRLLEPDQFSLLGDLKLFFLYTFRER